MKKLFARVRVYYDHKDRPFTGVTLPNGWFHSIDDKPAIINQGIVLLETNKKYGNPSRVFDLRVKFKWYKNGVHCRDNDQPATVDLGEFGSTDSVKLVLTELLTDPDYYKNIMYASPMSSNIVCVSDVEKFSFRHCDIRALKWYKDDKKHRDNDKPAEIWGCDDWTYMAWYQDGEKDRRGDKPVRITYDSGHMHKEWMVDDELISTDDEILKRYKNDKLHADNDQPAIINKEHGMYIWMQNGQIHRDNNQPAIVKTIQPPGYNWYEEYLYDNSNNQLEKYYTHGIPYTPS
jgi:hypothetical protein